MKPTPNVQLLTETVYSLMQSVFATTDGRRSVKLDSGGVLITAPDGDHVQVYVTSVHFEPGEAVPF